MNLYQCTGSLEYFLPYFYESNAFAAFIIQRSALHAYTYDVT